VTAEGCCAGAEESENASSEWIEYARIAFVGLAILLCWLKVWQPFARIDLLGLVCAIVGGYPIFKEAALDLWSRRMTMEL
jgi:Cd2+/Zn2+-exporting ATPase/Cu+-exporting ATPase